MRKPDRIARGPRPSSVARVPGIDYAELDSMLGYALKRAQIAAFEAFSRATAGVGDSRSGANDHRTTYAAVDDFRFLAHHDHTFQTRRRIDLALDAPAERIQNRSVCIEDVGRLAGILPPALHHVRQNFEAAIDEILDRIGDFVLVAPRRLDAPNRVEDVVIE